MDCSRFEAEQPDVFHHHSTCWASHQPHQALLWASSDTMVSVHKWQRSVPVTRWSSVSDKSLCSGLLSSESFLDRRFAGSLPVVSCCCSSVSQVCVAAARSVELKRELTPFPLRECQSVPYHLALHVTLHLNPTMNKQTKPPDIVGHNKTWDVHVTFKTPPTSELNGL